MLTVVNKISANSSKKGVNFNEKERGCTIYQKDPYGQNKGK